MPINRFIVSALPALVGKTFAADDFFAAHAAAVKAKADGFEGKLYGVDDAGELVEFDVAGKAFKPGKLPADQSPFR